MITVIATITCQPGCRADFLREFLTIVPEVLQEEGCIEYGPTIDASTELSNQHCDADRVTIVEKWTTLDALQAHLTAPHMESYRPKVKDFVLAAELRVLEAA